MRSAMFVCFLSVVTACSKADTQGAAAAAAETGMSAAAKPAISLSDVAGKWTTRAIDESGALLGTADLLATDNTSGWTLTFPNRKPIPMRVLSVSGDSVTTEMSYESSDHKGTQIRNRAVNLFHGNTMTGTLEAHVVTAGRDSLIHARLEGTREP
jgi:hypothetical protein